MKSFKRRQKYKEQETDLLRCHRRDKLERNQQKTVRRKGGNMWGMETNVLGRKPREGRR